MPRTGVSPTEARHQRRVDAAMASALDRKDLDFRWVMRSGNPDDWREIFSRALVAADKASAASATQSGDAIVPPAKVTLGEPPANVEAAVLWYERDEHKAFMAGFLCAGGSVEEVASWADSYMGNLRFSRGNAGGKGG